MPWPKTFSVTRGDCAGHPCDDCPTCRAGRCCRRDCLTYRLPNVGEWGGPISGRLGVLDGDGDSLVCHVCGGSFVGLGNHAWRAHDLTAAEYKGYFGFTQRTALATDDNRARHSEITRGAIRAGRIHLDEMAAASLQKWTPEQRSAAGRRGVERQRRRPPGTGPRGRDARRRTDMKTLTIAFAAATLALFLALAPAGVASADMGTFTTDDGISCTWFGVGNTVSVDCSGYSWRAGEFITYHCDEDFIGSSVSWRCRSRDGMTWSGSR